MMTKKRKGKKTRMAMKKRKKMMTKKRTKTMKKRTKMRTKRIRRAMIKRKCKKDGEKREGIYLCVCVCLDGI